MKKKYFQPAIEVTELITEDIICASTILSDKFDMGDAVAGSLSSSVENWSYTEGDTNTIQVR